MLAWFAMPWCTSYQLGAKLVMPIAARQPRILLVVVVMAAFSVVVATGARQHTWASVSVLAGIAGIAFSTLASQVLDAAAGRASEYAADQFAAQAGRSDQGPQSDTAFMQIVGNRQNSLHRAAKPVKLPKAQRVAGPQIVQRAGQLGPVDTTGTLVPKHAVTARANQASCCS